MTEEQRAAYVAALEEELAGYERVGATERAAGVVAELTRVGARKPAKPKRTRAKRSA